MILPSHHLNATTTKRFTIQLLQIFYKLINVQIVK